VARSCVCPAVADKIDCVCKFRVRANSNRAIRPAIWPRLRFSMAVSDVFLSSDAFGAGPCSSKPRTGAKLSGCTGQTQLMRPILEEAAEERPNRDTRPEFIPSGESSLRRGQTAPQHLLAAGNAPAANTDGRDLLECSAATRAGRDVVGTFWRWRWAARQAETGATSCEIDRAPAGAARRSDRMHKAGSAR
jgi:hypothetical protein